MANVLHHGWERGRAADLPIRVERKALVSLAIYDVSGRAVKVILREEFEPGEYVRPWDGRNVSGQ